MLKHINILNSPRVRLCISLVSSIIIGIFSSIFATEITRNGAVDWSLTFKTFSFWLLLFISILWVAVQVYYWKLDEQVMAFLDDGYCTAYIRKAKLEAITARLQANPSDADLYDVNAVLKELRVTKK